MNFPEEYLIGQNLNVDEIDRLIRHLQKIKKLKLSQKPLSVNGVPAYDNPYECIVKNRESKTQFYSPHADNTIGAYSRNIGIESNLRNAELTNTFNSRNKNKGMAINRFEDLRFNPQDPKHLVWDDGMPRGGYSARSDRTEY